MKYIIFFAALFASYKGNAQIATSKGHNLLGLSISAKRYFNKNNLENRHADNPIHPNNTNGFTVGAVYNRVTRYNLVLEAAIDYGQQKHDINIMQAFDHFDVEAKQNLAGLAYQRKVLATLRYIAPRLMVGYKYKIDNTWTAVGKLGISRALYLNGVRSDSNQAFIQYKLDNSNDYRVAKINAETYFFGESAYRSASKSRIWDDPLDSWELYVGAERTVKSFWIQKASLGLAFTRSIGSKLSPNLIEYYVTKWNQPVQSADIYVIKNLSLGLILGITF